MFNDGLLDRRLEARGYTVVCPSKEEQYRP